MRQESSLLECKDRHAIKFACVQKESKRNWRKTCRKSWRLSFERSPPYNLGISCSYKPTEFTVYLKEWSLWSFQIEKLFCLVVEHVLWDPLRGAGTYGMPISKMLFWISCFPNMMILSWMQSSIRQPPGAHWEEKLKDVMTVLWIELHNHYYFILQYSCRIRILIFMADFLD